MNRDDLKPLKKKMDISLNSQYIYEHIAPKYRKDIFDLYNEVLEYIEGKQYKDVELAKQVIEDWYKDYFKKDGGIKAKFLVKYTEFEKFQMKQLKYKS